MVIYSVWCRRGDVRDFRNAEDTWGFIARTYPNAVLRQYVRHGDCTGPGALIKLSSPVILIIEDGEVKGKIMRERDSIERPEQVGAPGMIG